MNAYHSTTNFLAIACFAYQVAHVEEYSLQAFINTGQHRSRSVEISRIQQHCCCIVSWTSNVGDIDFLQFLSELVCVVRTLRFTFLLWQHWKHGYSTTLFRIFVVAESFYLERRRIWDSVLNYALYKAIFVAAVVKLDFAELLVWLSWFVVFAVLRVAISLARHRLQLLKAVPVMQNEEEIYIYIYILRSSRK